MRPDDILDAIGNVDDSLLVTAQERPKPVKLLKHLTQLAPVAACVLLLLVLSFGFFILRGNEKESSGPPDSVQKEQALIYYVDNNEIVSSERLLPLNVEYLFEAWRNLNRLNENVRLIDISYAENTTTITITEALKTYYETVDATLLLNSLQLTLQHAFPSDYEDCRFTYE